LNKQQEQLKANTLEQETLLQQWENKVKEHKALEKTIHDLQLKRDEEIKRFEQEKEEEMRKLKMKLRESEEECAKLKTQLKEKEEELNLCHQQIEKEIQMSINKVKDGWKVQANKTFLDIQVSKCL
jgi:hypothetical protein